MATETESTETFTAQADAYAESREQQFLEVAGEIGAEVDLAEAPIDGSETPAGEEGAVPETPIADVPVEAPVAEADPFADAKPFSYTVDGQAKTYDGIKVFQDKDGTIQGGVIPADAIKDVQYRLQRGDYLETQNQQMYQQLKTLDALEHKLTDGNTVRGLDAVAHVVAENAKLHAAVKTLAHTLEDPERLAAIVSDPREMQLLSRELALQARDAENTARQTWGTRSTQHVRETQDASQVQETTTRAITASIDHWASRYPALTPDDKAAVLGTLQMVGAAVVRRATPDEAQQAGVRPGDFVIDHRVVDRHLSERHTLRASAAAAADAAKKAAQENAARMASAAKGKTTSPSTKGQPTRRPASPEAPKKSKLEEWNDQKSRMLTGSYAADDE